MFIGKTASDIFDHIRHLVQSGGLRPGEVLPPVRELASQLEVNRNTVAAAYKRLVTSGLAVSQGRNGTAIKARDPLPALEGGDPTTPLNDISSGNPDPARLPELTRYLGQLARTPRPVWRCSHRAAAWSMGRGVVCQRDSGSLCGESRQRSD
ncbi:transcriptional regulator of pyridoxine metabolism [Klebsiella variicola]|uniref:Transcriptional regulator of pyridoxine metabolism n=1 Tax=Klebsiella variicola TaxID=244366 RepID=A0A7H4MQ06_KLEVA|nr:transcriptional regulator of pyridoxine metabolism [Klebsiella variicola]